MDHVGAGNRSPLQTRARRRRVRPLAATLGLLVGAALLPLQAQAADPLVQDWPMFHRDIGHSGVSDETTIGAAAAPGLTLDWQASLGAPSYSSPAVAWNAQLGKRVAYVGNNAGALQAFDALTGQRIWWFRAGAAISSSVAIDGNVAYFGSNDHNLYALNAATGAELCHFPSGGVIASSPMVANPDGTGKIVYFGDNGLTGSDDGGDEWAVHAVDPSDAFPDCTESWRFSSFGDPKAGSWSPPAYGVDSAGRPTLVFGGSSPDNAVYAVDARTGELAWRYQTQVFAMDNDVGAGATISPPGVNGFADGVAYVTGKDAITFALNLKTGALIWQFSLRTAFGTAAGSPRSTAALVGNTLYLGYGAGVLALNATTGTKVWSTQQVGGRTQGIVSSPAVSGGAGDRVMFAGDFDGIVYGFAASTGARVWTYPTGALIYGSPAISAGHMYITSSTGSLYAFGLGGSSSAKPESVIGSPADGAVLAYPGTKLTASGSASDDVGVASVLVAVKNKNTNKYWDGATKQWTSIFTQNQAALGTPGGASTSWSFSFPMPTAGGPFLLQAEAQDGDGQLDPTPATSNFQVTGLGSPPETTITSPRLKQIFTFPGGIRQSFDVTASGGATDTAGTLPGVHRVNVIVLNIEHNEYFCGSPGCGGGGGESSSWTPFFTSVPATLASPDATSTGWSLTFPVYDHPHDYRVTAWAIDRDGQADQTRAKVTRFCVRDPGVTACG
jgi:outer membrane protein assembly factor BamB